MEPEKWKKLKKCSWVLTRENIWMRSWREVLLWITMTYLTNYISINGEKQRERESVVLLGYGFLHLHPLQRLDTRVTHGPCPRVPNSSAPLSAPSRAPSLQKLAPPPPERPILHPPQENRPHAKSHVPRSGAWGATAPRQTHWLTVLWN